MDGIRAPRIKLMLLLASMVALTCGTAIAADFTVVNKCSYTVYPGIYPATYANGGWEMSPGTQVSFTLNSGWIGRIWGRTDAIVPIPRSAPPASAVVRDCSVTARPAWRAPRSRNST